jgi:hypothetical protein
VGSVIVAGAWEGPLYLHADKSAGDGGGEGGRLVLKRAASQENRATRKSPALGTDELLMRRDQSRS